MAEGFPCLPPERPLRATKHCRHYGYENTGLSGFRTGNHGGPTCAVGCDNRTAPGASRACMPEPTAPCPCDKREEYTEAERLAWLAYRDGSLERSVVAMTGMPKDGWDGSYPCPACGTGTISWARARSNRHLHARCSTPRCFAVMQ